MSVATVDRFSYVDFPDKTSQPDRLIHDDSERDAAMQQLAFSMIHRHMLSEADPESALFDPLEGLSILKYHLIGNPQLIARYNSAFPPGVGRETRKGDRVYGVECAALIDTRTGWVEIVRKDDIVDSADPTDWLSVRYNVLSGEYDEPHVIAARTEATETGDRVNLTVDPPTDYMYANQGPSTISLALDSMYHASGQLVRGRQKYYGRGISGEPLQVEGVFDDDISHLFDALQSLIDAADLPHDLLDRGAKMREHDDRMKALGGHILTITPSNIYARTATRTDIG
jgi:hypothetical protein